MISSQKMTRKRHGAEKVSRHQKRYWRKGTNVQDIEEHLEKERQNERLGGDLSTRKDSELFTIDTSPVKTDKKPSSKGKKTIKLNSFKSLEPNPLIKAAKVSYPKKKTILAKRVKNFSKKADVSNSNESDNKSYDLWAQERNAKKTELDDDLEDYYLRQTKQKFVNIPNTRFQKVTRLAQIELPHPGASYNPEYEEHQDLISRAAGEEQRIIDAETNIEKKLKAESYATESSKLAEQSEGLFEQKKEENEMDNNAPESGDEEIYQSETGPTTAQRKLRSTRQKELSEKVERKTKEKERKEKKRGHEIFRLKSLKAELKLKEKEIAERSTKRKERREKRKLLGPASLGKSKYERMEEEFQMNNELVGNLRHLKPEGNLFVDRYKSLQRRNIISSGKLQKKRKSKKVKMVEKRGHREAANRLPV